jgi:TIR domain
MPRMVAPGACRGEGVANAKRHVRAALPPGPLVRVEPGFDAAVTSGAVGLMAESAAPSPGRIFLSYRREETAYPAGWLFDRLAENYGGQVFKDVDSIELGDDFVEVITRAVGSCDVLLALIGDQWLTINDEDGRRRLNDPEDFVRLEIEAALTRNVRVIPILVDGARMPRAAELPPSLAKLGRRQALELSPARFEYDTSRLLRVLDKTLAEVRTAQEHPARKSVPADKAPDLTTAEPPTAPERQQQAEPSPTHSIPPAVAAAPTGPSPLELSKPLDRSTREVKEAPEQGQRAESSLMPSVRPGAPTTYGEVLGNGLQVSERRPGAGEAGMPPGEGQLSDKPRRRLSRRAWILAAAGVALILLVVFIVANSNTDSVIFEDDFSSRESGWPDVGNETAGGHYKNDAYSVYAEALPGKNYAGGAPDASSVYPSAPPSINIDVEARRITGSSQDVEYGIFCRLVPDASWYAFTVKGESVRISRHDSSGDASLATGSASLVDGANELDATCDGDEGQTYVYLQLLVNGEPVAEATDENPLPAGGVALFAGAPNAEIATEVEFDNFVVTQD